MTHSPHPLSRRALMAALAALALPVRAQTWPARPLRLIVPTPVGSIGDLVARALGDRLASQLGQRLVVENRPVGGGTQGLEALARAAPDGYTLGFCAVGTIALSPLLGKLAYDPERDFTPVAGVMMSPLLLLATSLTPARTLGELLAHARDWPDTVRWATAGQASLGHLALEQLVADAGVRMVHIPYKGGSQPITDALGAQFELLAIQPSPGLLEHARSGRLRPLAVGAPRRLDTLPQVPTLAELGYSGANLASSFGVFAPANLPVRLLDRLNSEVNAALARPEFAALVRATENVPTGGTAREFGRLVLAEADAMAAIVRSTGIKAE